MNDVTRAIPRAPRTPLVGNIPDLVRHETLVDAFCEIGRTHGPLVEVDLPGARPILVSSYAHAREIWDDTRFRKQVGGPLLNVRAMAGDGLFTAFEDEPNWRLAHDLLMPAFGFRAMRAYLPQMVEIAEQLCARWDALEPDAWVEVTDDMTRLTLDTIGLCAFGARFESFARPAMHPFVDAMVRGLLECQKKSAVPSLLDKLRFGARRQLDSDIRLMNETVDDIIRQRRASGERADDLLDRMLHARHPETGAQLDDVNIRHQAITFLVAGHETTSGMLSFALHLLLQHPEALAEARAEVDRVLGPDRDARPTWEDVGRLSYVKQALKESLRLHPTAPFVGREAREETVVDGYRIEPGRDLVMLLPLLHRDPAAWGPDAERFDPHRFDKAAMAERPPHAFKGFGSGLRACIGSQFALVEATLALAMVLHRFELEPEPDYRLGLVQTLTVKPRDLRIRVRPRTPRALGRPTPAAATPTRAAPALESDTRLTLLYGSNMGTAEALAERLADAGERRGLGVDLGPLDAALEHGFAADGPLVVITSTYNGHPPDNARDFFARLDGDAPSGVAGRPYAVFGCGHSDWAATFQAVPRRVDARLAEWGAARLLPAGEGDAGDDLEGAFEAWSDALFDALAENLGIEAAPAEAHGPRYAVEIGPPQAANPFIASFGALPMRVLANRELQTWPGDGPARSTRHIELALPDGVSYEAGDHLGVIPHNDPAQVQAVARRFGLDPESMVRVRALGRHGGHLPLDRPLTLAELLSAYVELQDTATRAQVQTLAEHTRCPHTRAELQRLAAPGPEGAWRAEILQPRRSVLDLLARFTACALPFHVYLGMLPPLRPRYYSIASSPLVDPRRCSITVGVLRREGPDGEVVHGVCSNHLARAPVGSRVQAFVRDTGSDFRLPVDARTPTIMIGAGTGLAPFVGFLQARTALAERGLTVGPDALFFGCRHPERDFLYRELLDALVESGRLQLYPAFSRLDGQPKTYVQDRIGAEAEAVWALIEQGAVIYVCGDAGAMEPGVRAALQAIHEARTGGDAAGSAAWVDALRAAGRYRTDVWASG